MKINQLFRVTVPNELFFKLYRAFGYTELTEDYMFCKSDLERLEIVDKMSEYKDELCQYYIPCKAKLYLTNITINKCITIFRQILRLNNIVLMSRQKYIKHKKTTFYYIKMHHSANEESLDNLHHMRVNNNYMVLNFS